MTDRTVRPDLQKQYELVLQEYRFQVQLNWDRAKHYLVFNTAIFGAAVALYNDAQHWAYAGVGALLFLAAFNSYVGTRALRLGHEFYQNIRATKALLERELGIEAFAILSTPGMRRDHGIEADGTPEAGRQRRRKITSDMRNLLWALCGISTLGALYSAYACWMSFQ